MFLYKFFKSVILVSILFSLSLSSILNDQQDLKFWRISPVYPRLAFWIDKNTQFDYMNELRSNSPWDGVPNMIVVLNNMEECFYEAVDQYKKKKHLLPSCLRIGIDMLLNDLKKPGKIILNCIWYKNDNVSWQTFGRNDFRYNLIDEEAQGYSTKKQYIYLGNLWKKDFQYKNKKAQIRTVKTSSILMHELIHCVKKHYKDCFRELSREREEGTTEQGEILIYGEENCGTFYKDFKSWTTRCTYSNICICKIDCPDSAGDIIK